MFAAFGTLTDCGLKFTKDGKFRKFGFVGFKSEEDASKALTHFNKSFVDTSRVTVSDRVTQLQLNFHLKLCRSDVTHSLDICFILFSPISEDAYIIQPYE